MTNREIKEYYAKQHEARFTQGEVETRDYVIALEIGSLLAISAILLTVLTIIV